MKPSTSGAIAYRDLGLLKPKQAGTKRIGKRDHTVLAMGGTTMWVWETAPPVAVWEALDDLCPDIPYLGQADSPVRLWTVGGPERPYTHRRDPKPRMSTGRADDIEVSAPRQGRTAALVSSYADRGAAKVPTPAADKAKADEKQLPPPIVVDRLGSERFVPVERTASRAPWAWCWILPFAATDHFRIERTDAVAFSVAFHRTLVSMFDGDAPPLLTGKYDQGASVPANRLAIQVISASPLVRHKIRADQAFVIAIPRGADSGDIAVVESALRSAREIRARGKRVRIVRPGQEIQMLDAQEFWNPPAPEMARAWSVLPAVVETRSQGKNWTLADAVALSIGLVWRDEFDAEQWRDLRGERRYRWIAEQVRRWGATVLGARPIPTSQVDRFVHKIPEGLMPLPYTATVVLGDLEPSSTAFAAIGQSRHLGGGLLVPHDVSRDVLESWDLRS
jgi:CRISPR-associated protein Csb2